MYTARSVEASLTTDIVDRLAAQASREHAAAVEHAILAGANRVEVEGYAGHTRVYEVPSWRSQPRQRLRVTVARLRARVRATR